MTKELQKAERLFKVSLSLWALTVTVVLAGAWSGQTKSASFEQVKARSLVIVDENGTERIIIGSPVPDPIVEGKRIERAQPSTGIVFNNAMGNEVSGWGVFPDGNQNLCMDFPDGKGESLCLLQAGDRGGFVVKARNGSIVAMLGKIGYEEDGPKLFLSDLQGRTRIKLHADGPASTPKLELIGEDGNPFFAVSEPRNLTDK
ncbi:MAG TPA: hypothetical protein VMM38_07125 [Aridibacter sp.]|nr:hypothetical protein [Aridibacter sp.]